MPRDGNASPTDGRFPKAERLRTSAEFSQVLQEGRWVSTPYFVVYYLPARTRRVGVAASRRFPNKPRRNRARRRLRELYRLHKTWFSPGWYVLMARPPILEARWQELVQTLKEALARLFPASSSG